MAGKDDGIVHQMADVADQVIDFGHPTANNYGKKLMKLMVAVCVFIFLSMMTWSFVQDGADTVGLPKAAAKISTMMSSDVPAASEAEESGKDSDVPDAE